MPKYRVEFERSCSVVIEADTVEEAEQFAFYEINNMCDAEFNHDTGWLMIDETKELGDD